MTKPDPEFRGPDPWKQGSKEDVERKLLVELSKLDVWDDRQIGWYAGWLATTKQVDEVTLRMFAAQVERLVTWKSTVMTEFEEVELEPGQSYLGGLYAKAHPNGQVEVQLQSPVTGGRNHVGWATSPTEDGSSE